MKKKLLILISMLAMMFSLSACDNEAEAPFEYDRDEMVYNTMYLFEIYNGVHDEYADYYISDGADIAQSAVKGIRQAKESDGVGEFESYAPYMEAFRYTGILSVDYEVKNAGDSVAVTLTNHAQNRDVEITVRYKENPDYYILLDQAKQENDPEYIRQVIEENFGSVEEYFATYNPAYSSVEELAEAGIADMMAGQIPYIPEEMVVSAVYSKSELIKQAGINTAIGMGTVFVVLIFISFIISLFKFLPALFAKKPKVEDLKKEPVKAPVVKKEPPAAPPVAEDSDLMQDEELVAVITAAIYAMAGQGYSGATSKDTLVVRSIRRSRR